MVVFAPVLTLTAEEAARVFYTEWIARYGVPAVIRSDNGSAFVANMMDAVRRILGTQAWNFSCTNNPTHHSLLEVRHRILDTVLNTAYEKGDLSSSTVRFYCAIGEMRHNFYTNSRGITPFEVVTGETPRTPHNFMMIPTNADLNELNVTYMDRDFIRRLRDEIRDLIVWIHFRDDERLHKEKAHRLTQEYNCRTKIFEYRLGDLVSIQGQVATILEFIQATVTGPAKVRIQITNHESSTD